MLSILIPTYNYNIFPLAEVLHKQCLNENIPFEIIALDDGSDQNYIDHNQFIDTLSNCRFLRNTHNLGRTMTRKKLAEAAGYEMLLFLDADVIPVNTDFIKNYIPYLHNDYPVVCGGVAYQKNIVNPATALRHKYGRCREEQPAHIRNKNPYGSILSANLLIDKMVFLENNYAEDQKYYGMDIFFSYRLYKNNVAATHIDNPVYHLGLEENTAFFKKSLEAVLARKELLVDKDNIEGINALLKSYKKLKKYHLTGMISLLFKLGEPLLKKMILSKNPNLFCLDLYRLGYICSLT